MKMFEKFFCTIFPYFLETLKNRKNMMTEEHTKLLQSQTRGLKSHNDAVNKFKLGLRINNREVICLALRNVQGGYH